MIMLMTILIALTGPMLPVCCNADSLLAATCTAEIHTGNPVNVCQRVAAKDYYIHSPEAFELYLKFLLGKGAELDSIEDLSYEERFGLVMYVFTNGDVYVGQEVKQKAGYFRHGVGVFRSADGDAPADGAIYEGNWRNGHKDGKGMWTFSNGTVASYDFRDGLVRVLSHPSTACASVDYTYAYPDEWTVHNTSCGAGIARQRTEIEMCPARVGCTCSHQRPLTVQREDQPRCSRNPCNGANIGKSDLGFAVCVCLGETPLCTGGQCKGAKRVQSGALVNYWSVDGCDDCKCNACPPTFHTYSWSDWAPKAAGVACSGEDVRWSIGTCTTPDVCKPSCEHSRPPQPQVRKQQECCSPESNAVKMASPDGRPTCGCPTSHPACTGTECIAGTVGQCNSTRMKQRTVSFWIAGACSNCRCQVCPIIEYTYGWDTWHQKRKDVFCGDEETRESTETCNAPYACECTNKVPFMSNQVQTRKQFDCCSIWSGATSTAYSNGEVSCVCPHTAPSCSGAGCKTSTYAQSGKELTFWKMGTCSECKCIGCKATAHTDQWSAWKPKTAGVSCGGDDIREIVKRTCLAAPGCTCTATTPARYVTRKQHACCNPGSGSVLAKTMSNTSVCYCPADAPACTGVNCIESTFNHSGEKVHLWTPGRCGDCKCERCPSVDYAYTWTDWTPKVPLKVEFVKSNQARDLDDAKRSKAMTSMLGRDRRLVSGVVACGGVDVRAPIETCACPYACSCRNRLKKKPEGRKQQPCCNVESGAVVTANLFGARRCECPSINPHCTGAGCQKRTRDNNLGATEYWQVGTCENCKCSRCPVVGFAYTWSNWKPRIKGVKCGGEDSRDPIEHCNAATSCACSSKKYLLPEFKQQLACCHASSGATLRTLSADAADVDGIGVEGQYKLHTYSSCACENNTHCTGANCLPGHIADTTLSLWLVGGCNDCTCKVCPETDYKYHWTEWQSKSVATCGGEDERKSIESCALFTIAGACKCTNKLPFMANQVQTKTQLECDIYSLVVRMLFDGSAQNNGRNINIILIMTLILMFYCDFRQLCIAKGTNDEESPMIYWIEFEESPLPQSPESRNVQHSNIPRKSRQHTRQPFGAKEIFIKKAKEAVVSEKQAVAESNRAADHPQRAGEQHTTTVLNKMTVAGRGSIHSDGVADQITQNGAERKAAEKQTVLKRKAAAMKYNRKAEAKAAAETKAVVKRRAAAEAKAAAEKQAAAEKRAAIQKQAAAEKRAAVEKQAAEEKRAAVEKQAAEEERAAIAKRAAEEKRAAVEKRAAAETKAAVEKRAAAETKAAETKAKIDTTVARTAAMTVAALVDALCTFVVDGIIADQTRRQQEDALRQEYAAAAAVAIRQAVAAEKKAKVDRIAIAKMNAALLAVAEEKITAKINLAMQCAQETVVEALFNAAIVDEVNIQLQNEKVAADRMRAKVEVAIKIIETVTAATLVDALCESSISDLFLRNAEAANEHQHTQNTMCVSCWENPRCMLCLPCRHLQLCEGCSRRWGPSCPSCREEVQQYLKIFT